MTVVSDDGSLTLSGQHSTLAGCGHGGPPSAKGRLRPASEKSEALTSHLFRLHNSLAQLGPEPCPVAPQTPSLPQPMMTFRRFVSLGLSVLHAPGCFYATLVCIHCIILRSYSIENYASQQEILNFYLCCYER